MAACTPLGTSSPVYLVLCFQEHNSSATVRSSGYQNRVTSVKTVAGDRDPDVAMSSFGQSSTNDLAATLYFQRGCQEGQTVTSCVGGLCRLIRRLQELDIVVEGQLQMS